MLIIEKELLETFNDDIPNKVMAMLVSAIYGDVVWTVKTEELLSETVALFENMATIFRYYYYDYEGNEGEQCDYAEIIDDNEIEELIAKNSVSSLIADTDNNKTIYCCTHSWTLATKKEVDGFKLTLSIDNKDKLMQALTSYFSRYEANYLENKYENILFKEAHEKHLIDILTKDEYDLSFFHVNDIKYIKPICYGIIKETIFLHSACIKLDEDSEVTNFKCIIDCTDFIENAKTEPSELTGIKLTNEKLALIKKLTEIERIVISARAYLDVNSGKLRVGYKNIAEFLTNNGIYKITENNIKQKVSSIYSKLGIQDLSIAVLLLKDANGLISYDNIKGI